MILLSFGICLLLFSIIGILSSLKSQRNEADYLLAGRNVKPWLVALSAVATNNSGYMFIGVVGYTYTIGLSVIWMMIGFIFGDFVSSLFVHKKIRIESQKEQALSFPEIISRWHGNNFRLFRIISALILVVFLSVYAAAQLRAGGKALHVLFGWDYAIGSLIGAVLVLLYCFSGGIRASIWTDAAQSFVMILSIAILLIFALDEIGGFSNFITALQNISPTYLDLLPQHLPFQPFVGPALFLIGWFFGGFGIIGQPHIMVRFMTMKKPSDINRVRLYYYSWYVAFYLMIIGVGFASRILIPSAADFDPELALPTLSNQLLPEILVGLMLAGIFAATMSTADSQILSCSASINNDFGFKKKNSYRTAKLATIFVTVFATAISLTENQSVFSLVMVGWLALACAFTPLITIYAFGKNVSEKTAIAMMFCGFFTMLLWRYFGLGEFIYEAAPGILAGFAPYFMAQKSTTSRSAS